MLFFPKKSRAQVFENNLEIHPLVQKFKKIDAISYEVTLVSAVKLIIRDFNYSDCAVFLQIFQDQEYAIVLKMLQLNSNFIGEKILIDAGANVGYTTVFFSENLDNVKIFAIEPSESNVAYFIKNTDFLKEKSKIKLYQKALCESENKFFDIDRDFRDGKDWSITTKEVANGVVAGITLSEIIKQNNLEYISLLKIDIEGAERFLFTEQSDVSFLDITQIIALEIHDEYPCRNAITKILLDRNFFLMESGELTIGIKKTLFQ